MLYVKEILVLDLLSFTWIGICFHSKSFTWFSGEFIFEGQRTKWHGKQASILYYCKGFGMENIRNALFSNTEMIMMLISIIIAVLSPLN